MEKLTEKNKEVAAKPEIEKNEEQYIRNKEERERKETGERVKRWQPKTRLGKEVKEGKIKNIDEAIKNYKILEEEIVDSLLKLKSELLNIGQSKGKFGGGKRRAWRQTQRKSAEGNVPTFSCMAVVGDSNGHVGIGLGKGKETLPAREKALRKAKLSITKIKRGCGSFDCSCSEEHSIPFKVKGKCGSVIIELIPAQQGAGLVIGDEGKKILRLAGIKDLFRRAFGQSRTTINYAKAVMNALSKIHEV